MDEQVIDQVTGVLGKELNIDYGSVELNDHDLRAIATAVVAKLRELGILRTDVVIGLARVQAGTENGVETVKL